MRITAFYYGADVSPAEHVLYDVDQKILSQASSLPFDARYVVLVSHHGIATTHVVTAECGVVTTRGVTLPGPMSSPQALAWFLTDIVVDTGALTDIFFSCHASGHALYPDGTDDDDALSLNDVARVLETVGVPSLTSVYLDGCCQATLEAVDTFRNVCTHIVAYETFCPWEGLISFNSMVACDPVALAKESILRYDSRPMLPDEQPADVSVLATARAHDVLVGLRAFLTPSDFCNDTANPEFPYHHDEGWEDAATYDVVACLKDMLLRADDAARHEEARMWLTIVEREMIVFYKKSATNPLRTNGVAIYQRPLK